jgi:hypothetical protein
VHWRRYVVFLLLGDCEQMITVLDIALTSISPRVRCSAVDLLSKLTSRLPLPTMLSNIHLICSCACLGFEGRQDSKELSMTRAAGDYELLTSKMAEYKPAIRSAPSSEYPAVMASFLDMLTADMIDAQLLTACRRSSTDLLSELFITRFSETEGYLEKVVFLPALPELSVVSTVCDRIIKQKSVADHFDNVLNLLNHESSHVRKMALSRLRQLCTEHRRMTERALLQEDLPNASLTRSQVLRALRQLLFLASKETDKASVSLCSCCLGLLGAIDPGRIDEEAFTLLSQHADHAKTAKLPPPWEQTGLDLGLYLLEHHLVPSLRSAARFQDRSGFAIQTILKILSEENNSPSSSMPPGLRIRLSELNILENVEPFWSTRYALRDLTEVKSPPLFHPNVSFTRWIGQWVRYIGSYCQGPLSKYFTACKGAVNNLFGLSQDLLPYVICDVLISNTREISKEQQTGIVSEICLVLQGAHVESDALGRSKSSNSGTGSRPMAIQAVFELLDILTAWASIPLPTRSQSPAPGSAAASPRPPSGDGAAALQVGVHRAIKQLIDLIPKRALFIAAMSINAHGRALRYFETFIRDNNSPRIKMTSGNSRHRSVRSLISSLARNDGSNGGLPRLSEDELDELLTISANVNISDAVRGVLSLRLMSGFSPTYRSRILDYEQREDYLHALSEYNSLHWLANRDIGVESESVKCASGDGTLRHFVHENIESIEQGRLRCLIELGQLETAIDQVCSTKLAKYDC